MSTLAPGFLPFDALERWILTNDPPQRVDRSRHANTKCTVAMLTPAAYAAERLGVHRAVVHRWRRRGMTIRDADRVAIALGTHPMLIWPDFHDIPPHRPLRAVS